MKYFHSILELQNKLPTILQLKYNIMEIYSVDFELKMFYLKKKSSVHHFILNSRLHNRVQIKINQG